MSWHYNSAERKSFTNLSIHQSLVYKALYEHGNSQTIATLASTSLSFRSSSLGPNLLQLIEIDDVHTRVIFSHLFPPLKQVAPVAAASSENTNSNNHDNDEKS